MVQTNLDGWVKIFTLIGAVVAFVWGAYLFLETQRTQVETRRIEATRPFLDRQLKLYTEATQSAATMATSASREDIALAVQRFWSLYWGELALVEDEGVEAAMVNLGQALERGKTGEELKGFSLELAHACRNSLAKSWGVQQWRKPYPERRSIT